MKMMLRRFWFYPLLILIPGLWLMRLLTQAMPANDFYPLYYGAQRLLAGLSPYGAEATQALALRWDGLFVRGGIAYPVPFLLLVVPLTLLALPLATFVWSALGFTLTYLSVKISHHSGWQQWLILLLPFVFWPVYRGFELAQATLLWTGMAVVLVLAIQRTRPGIVAVCVVLLMLKPQNGAIFALYGLYWLLRFHKRWLALSVLCATLLLGMSLAMQPEWIQSWVSQVRTYDHFIDPYYLMPVGLVPLLACLRLRLHWVAKLAIAQVILFPLSDMYSTLPLLLAWATSAPPLALLGAAVTWVPILGAMPDYLHSSQIWLFAIAPLLLVALWEGRPKALSAPTPQQAIEVASELL